MWSARSVFRDLPGSHDSELKNVPLCPGVKALEQRMWLSAETDLNLPQMNFWKWLEKEFRKLVSEFKCVYKLNFWCWFQGGGLVFEPKSICFLWGVLLTVPSWFPMGLLMSPTPAQICHQRASLLSLNSSGEMAVKKKSRGVSVEVLPFSIPPSLLQSEEHPAEIQLCAGGLRQCQNKPQRQFQPVWKVHGHQLWFQGRPHRWAHQ